MEVKKNPTIFANPLIPEELPPPLFCGHAKLDAHPPHTLNGDCKVGV